VGRLRRDGSQASRHPRHLRALVHKRHRSDRHGPPPDYHDFFGFPQALFDVEYPAPGLSSLADEVTELADPIWVGHDLDSWGIDHGTWSVLCHAYPAADVPVVQLAINGSLPARYHFDLGRRLALLRARGVLIAASGNVVHNLRRIDPSLPTEGFDWAQRFEQAAREALTEDPERILELDTHPDYPLAVPTPDHFLPAVYLAGLAAETGERCRPLVDGYTFGSLSMTSYTIGADLAEPAAVSRADSALLPDPTNVPPEDTNL